MDVIFYTKLCTANCILEFKQICYYIFQAPDPSQLTPKFLLKQASSQLVDSASTLFSQAASSLHSCNEDLIDVGKICPKTFHTFSKFLKCMFQNFKKNLKSMYNSYSFFIKLFSHAFTKEKNTKSIDKGKTVDSIKLYWRK